MAKSLVRVDDKIKGKVEKRIAGTKVKLGQFYDEAVKLKLSIDNKKAVDLSKND